MQSTWIPISERLPEGEDFYLVSAIGDDGPLVTNGEFNSGSWWTDQRLIGPGEVPVKVLAWMPLPAPYGANG